MQPHSNINVDNGSLLCMTSAFILDPVTHFPSACIDLLCTYIFLFSSDLTVIVPFHFYPACTEVSSLHRDDINYMERLTVKEVLVGTTSREVLPSRPHCKMNGNKIGSKDKEVHECRQCFIIFSNEPSMLRHNRKFHEEEYMQLLQKNNTVFLCYKCNQRFQSSAKLRQHNLSHGTDDKPFRCEVCREGYSRFAELLTHRREVCPKRKFHCKVCGMNFQNLDSLETHKSIHLPRRRGRPAKKKGTEWGTPEKETMSPEKEEEEEEEEEEELDGRAEDQRAPWSQTSWIPDKETMVLEEVELDARAEDQRAPWSQTSWTPDMKTMVPKEEEEEEEEVDNRSDAQRALRPHTSSPQGSASESQQPGYNIPCPVDNCDLTFPSVEALRVHKKDVHRPQPAPRLP
ncbi:unnamed protein product [Lota lota]